MVIQRNSDSIMDRYYEALDSDRRRWFFETVAEQIHALLGLEIDAPVEPAAAPSDLNGTGRV